MVRMIEGCSPRDLTPFRVSYMYQPVYLLGSIKSAAIPPILVSPLPALPAHRQSQILAAWNPQLHALGWAISRHSYKTSRTGLHNQYVEHRQLVRPADTPSPSRPRPYSVTSALCIHTISGRTLERGDTFSVRPYLGAAARSSALWRWSLRPWEWIKPQTTDQPRSDGNTQPWTGSPEVLDAVVTDLRMHRAGVRSLTLRDLIAEHTARG